MTEAPAKQGLLVVLGAGGHAASLASVALAAGHSIRCFVDPRLAPGRLLGVDIRAELPGDLPPDCGFAVAAGDNARREDIVRQLQLSRPGAAFPVLVHPSAVLSVAVRVGAGTVIMPQVAVGPNSEIGAFCILNTASAIDHDARMADFASLAPGAVAGGNVSVGERAAISIGAVVKHGVALGADAVLGANSYLNRDLPSCRLAYGSPARVIRVRERGTPYLG